MSALDFRLLFTRSLRPLARISAVSLGLMFGCGPQSPAASPDETPPAGSAAPAAAAQGTSSDAQYVTLPPEQREAPPPASASPAWKFPAIADTTLDNGMGIKALQRSTLPLVELKLIVRSGQATDGGKPGLAVLAGEMLKVGGTAQWTSQQLLDKVESLGSSLHVLTSRDATSLSMAVTSDRFEEALDLLALVAQKPRFSDTEFRKLKRREMDRVSSAARTSASWAANMVLYRELFRLPSGEHPYAAYDATEKQVERLGLWEVKRWHQSHFTPKNSTLVISGDVPAERVASAAGKAFGTWKGSEPPSAEYPAPPAIEGVRIFLVDRPKSPQAELLVALWGPPQSSDDYPTLKVANQVLGGGVAGRLFLDVREKRSLAYSTRSGVERMSQGPEPIILSAGTQTAKAGLTLSGLLEHAKLMDQAPPTDAEVAIASRYLSDLFLLQMESVSALGSMVSNLVVFGLPNDYYDRYRQAVSSATQPMVEKISKRYFGGAGVLVVVAGDAERLGAPLSHFGSVSVVDTENEFKIEKEIAHDPNATIELQRLDGT